MPTRSSERWIHDGDNIRKALEERGYEVDLQCAENDIPTQADQIENQVTKGAKLLVVASVDGTALTSQLRQAEDAKIPVIAYARLLRNTDSVDCYATFFFNGAMSVLQPHIDEGTLVVKRGQADFKTVAILR